MCELIKIYFPTGVGVLTAIHGKYVRNVKKWSLNHVIVVGSHSFNPLPTPSHPVFTTGP